jgi:hypothetical protein
MYFAGSTRTQYFEAPPFFVPAAGITVWVVGAFGVLGTASLALRLQHRGQPGRTGPRSGDFSACAVAQPYAVKTVTVMSNVLDCLQVHHGMPSDLDKRIAT